MQPTGEQPNISQEELDRVYKEKIIPNLQELSKLEIGYKLTFNMTTGQISVVSGNFFIRNIRRYMPTGWSDNLKNLPDFTNGLVAMYTNKIKIDEIKLFESVKTGLLKLKETYESEKTKENNVNLINTAIKDIETLLEKPASQAGSLLEIYKNYIENRLYEISEYDEQNYQENAKQILKTIEYLIYNGESMGLLSNEDIGNFLSKCIEKFDPKVLHERVLLLSNSKSLFFQMITNIQKALERPMGIEAKTGFQTDKGKIRNELNVLEDNFYNTEVSNENFNKEIEDQKEKLNILIKMYGNQ